MRSALNNAALHQTMYDYVRGVFETATGDTAELKKQLDDLLESLVTNYDSEELPYRKDYRFATLVV